MTLESLANIGEALGGIAVLISLVYLVLEVRRNTKSVRASSAWNADVALSTLNEGIAQNPQLSELCVRAMSPETKPEDFTSEEYAQIFFIVRAVLQKYQAQWALWREGTLSEDMWQNRRAWAKAFISLPIPAKLWESEKLQNQYIAEFVESIESMEQLSEINIGG